MRYANHFLRPLTGLSLVLALLLSAGAQAQMLIEEIIVTAQKREQNVQDVPISISAFSGDFIEASGADDLQSLAYYTPNLTLSRSSQLANNRILLRGVGSVGNSAIEPAVAVFIDGVYYPRPSSVIGNLTDLELVEVLRGPQGTLFGRNASVGALNIRTRRPTREFEGKLTARYGNYDAKYVAGSLSSALSPAAAGRLAFHYADRNGYASNRFTERDSRSKVGAYEDMSVRGKLHFDQGENLEVNVSVDYARINNEGGPISVIADTYIPTTNPTVPRYDFVLSSALDATAVPGQRPPRSVGSLPVLDDTFSFDLNQDHRDTAKDEQLGLALDWTWSVGEHDIRSITAIRQWENYTYETSLRLPADLLNRVTDYEVDTLSQELQFISPAGGRLEYVAGLYYYRENYNIDQQFDLGADFCQSTNNLAFLLGLRRTLDALQPAVAAGQLTAQAAQAQAATIGLRAGAGLNGVCRRGPLTGGVDVDFRQKMTSYAAFGQATFRFNEQLLLTTGLRVTRDKKSGSLGQVVNNRTLAPAAIPGPPGQAPTLPGLDFRIDEPAAPLAFKDTALTWLANISYYPTEDIMLFATASTGFKSGGFNPDGFNSVGRDRKVSRVFESETTDNYELGVKSSWLEQRLSANLTLFHTKIADFQDRQFDGINFFVQNAGKLTQQGVELDLIANPIEPLYVVVGASYLDSEFNSFPNATPLPAQIALDPTASRDLAGQRNHFSPKWQVSVVAEYAAALLPDAGIDGFLRGEFQHISQQNIGAETNQNPQSLQAAYELVNARAGLRGAADQGWELAVFVKNAFNKGYCQTIFNQPIGITLQLVDRATGGGLQRCVLGTPRTYGAEVRYRF